MQEKKLFQWSWRLLFPDPTKSLETYEQYCLNKSADMEYLQKSFIRTLSTTPG